MTLNANVRKTVSTKLEEYEGRIDHLYLDIKGKVTVGIGHMIPNAPAMTAVPMHLRGSQVAKLATFEQKKNEYEVIKKQRAGSRASAYKPHTTLYMKQASIDAQRDNHIHSFYRELCSIYRESNGYKNRFENFPENAQIALFDMIFNLGATKLQNVFINFNQAVKSEDWSKAAEESYRPDVPENRNDFVKGLLQKLSES